MDEINAWDTGAVKKGAESLLRCMQTGFVIDRVAYWFIAQTDRFLSESDPLRSRPLSGGLSSSLPLKPMLSTGRQYIRENEWVCM